MAREPHSRTNAVFAAVSNPDRRKILDMLSEGERPAGELVAAFPGLPQPAISRQLKILRDAGLVVVSPRAQQRIYSLAPGRLREVDAWIASYRGFWSGRLDSLERHLNRAGARADDRRGEPQC